MDRPPDALACLLADEVASVPSAPVVTVADAARLRHGRAVLAVLFYGSCLRLQSVEGRIVDLYLLTESYRQVYRNWGMRALNALLPPNVYRIEAPLDGRIIRAKYAIVSLDQFERLVSRRTFDPYFWARFSQPTVVLWARDEHVKARITNALACAIRTMLRETLPLLPIGAAPERLWPRAFTETYRTELRAESSEQSLCLYHAFADRYDQVTEVVLRQQSGATRDAQTQRRAASRWRWRRVLGKFLSVLRLIKAGLTFEDGAAYLAWKIRRHSGVEIELTPWQQRHPILASSVLAWRLYRAGGFR
jgi:hypothetical protein